MSIRNKFQHKKKRSIKSLCAILGTYPHFYVKNIKVILNIHIIYLFISLLVILETKKLYNVRLEKHTKNTITSFNLKKKKNLGHDILKYLL